MLLVAMGLGLALRVALMAVLGTSNAAVSEFGVIGANLSHGHGFTYFAAFPDHGVIPAADMGEGLKPAADVGFDRPTPFVGDPQPGAFMPPLYPAIAGLADEVTSSRPDQIRLLQLFNLALFLALAYALFKLGSLLLGPEVGGLVALCSAAYPALVYMPTQVSASNLYLPAEAAMLVLAIKAVRSPLSWRLAAGCGALVSLVALLRPEGIVLGALIAVMVALAARRAGAEWRRTVQTAGTLVVVAALPVGAWLVRNTATFGRPTLTISSQAGYVLWAGNHEGATGSGKTLTRGQEAVAKERALLAQAAALPPGRTYELRRDALFRREALSWMADHPLDAAAGMARKVVLLGVADPGDRRSLNPGYLLSWAVLAVLAAVGVRRLRPRGVGWRLVLVYACLSFLVPVLFVTLPRYRLPVDMVLFVPAAWLVTTHPWYERVRNALPFMRAPARAA